MINRIIRYYQKNNNLTLSKIKLEELQSRKLKQIVHHAYENIPFYYKSFKKKGISPSDIQNIDDLKKIPIISKKDIQNTPIREFIWNNDFKKSIQRTTSGSTGNPLTVYIDNETEFLDNVEWTRSMFRNGLSVWDKMTVISDPRYFPKKRMIEKFGLMRRNYISIFNHSNSQLEKMIRFQPNVIRGYPSTLSIIIRENPTLKDKIIPKILFTSGELLDHETRENILNAYNLDLFDFYVCNEFSQLAWECKSHNGYHINADSKYVEIINGEEQAAPGETGEIVVTRLGNFLMPLLRYRIGDIGKIQEDKCSCGVTFPLLEMIEGRTDDLMVTTDGKIISPLIFFPYPFDSFEGISQFRVIQESRNKIILQIVSNTNFKYNDAMFEKARKAVKEVFGETIDVDFVFLKKIDPEPSGKIKKIISKVKIPIL